MGIIDPKNAHALRRPVQHYAFQFFPQRARCVAFKVERINILILLRRIFRVLDAAVRPVLKPVRVLLDVGMIRRADVYKRQVTAKTKSKIQALAVRLPPLKSAAIETRKTGTAPASIDTTHPRCAEKDFRQTCLLYTSRCV